MRPKGTKNNMRTPEEKEKIVCYAKSYGVTETSKFYSIHRRTIYKWLDKYRKNGIDGLNSKTGKAGGDLHGRPFVNCSSMY